MKQSATQPSLIRQVVFDFGQVCTEAQQPEPVSAMSARLGLSQTDFVAAYFHYRPPYDAGSISAGEFWRYLSDQSDSQLDWLIDQDYQSWNSPNPPMLALIRELAGQKQPLVLLSNMPLDLKQRFMAEWPDLLLFDRHYFSCDLGHCKPDPAIFERVIQDTAIPPHQTLFIDDLAPNIAAAKNLGWQTIWFQNNQQVLTELRTNFRLQSGFNR